MAIKKIQMVPEGANDYGDILHPETSADVIIGQGLFGITSGTNTYTVSMPNVTSLYAGLRITVKFAIANTGASTINVSSLGAKSILKTGGVILTSGNLKVNGVYTLVYDGTSFQLQGEGGSGNALASDLLSGKTASTDAGDITGSMPNRGAINASVESGNQYAVPVGYHNGSGKITATLPEYISYADLKMSVPPISWITYSPANTARDIFYHQESNKVVFVIGTNTGGHGGIIAIKEDYLDTPGSPIQTQISYSNTPVLASYTRGDGKVALCFRSNIIRIIDIVNNVLDSTIYAPIGGTVESVYVSSDGTKCAYSCNMGTTHSIYLVNTVNNTLIRNFAVTYASATYKSVQNLCVLNDGTVYFSMRRAASFDRLCMITSSGSYTYTDSLFNTLNYIYTNGWKDEIYIDGMPSAGGTRGYLYTVNKSFTVIKTFNMYGLMPFVNTDQETNFYIDKTYASKPEVYNYDLVKTLTMGDLPTSSGTGTVFYTAPAILPSGRIFFTSGFGSSSSRYLCEVKRMFKTL